MRSIRFSLVVLLLAASLGACHSSAPPPPKTVAGEPMDMGTYSWSEGKWVSRAATAPVAPWITYDEQQRYVTAIGDYNDGWPGGWTWHGQGWVKSNVPDRRVRMTDGDIWFDAVRGGLMLYAQGKTYALVGTVWTEIATPSPPSRLDVTLAYDPVRKEALLFGFGTESTWVWNGATWTVKQPTHQLPSRVGAAVAYNPKLGGVALFGGDNGPVQLRDTWLWNGVDWIQLDSGSSLPSRTVDDPRSALGFDIAGSTMYLVIETNRTEILTYAWTSGGWQLQRQATRQRSMQADCGLGARPLRMVYDNGNGYLLLLLSQKLGCISGKVPNLP